MYVPKNDETTILKIFTHTRISKKYRNIYSTNIKLNFHNFAEKATTLEQL